MATKDKNGDYHSEANGRFVSRGASDANEGKYPGTGQGTIIPGEGEPLDMKKIPFGFFGYKMKSKAEQGPKEIPQPPKEAYGFANKERLNTKHHNNHKIDMGYKDVKAYERAAIDF